MQDYTAAPTRPTSLTVIAVVAIVLGALSSCCGLYAGFGLVMSDRMQAMSQQLAGVGRTADDPMVQEQRAMQAELLEFQRSWAPFTGGFVVVQLFVALLCILGGALALTGKGVGRVMLMGTFVFGTLFELGRAATETIMQFQMTDVTQRYMTRAMAVAQSQHGGATVPGMEQTMGAVMGGATAAGIVLLLLWALVKIGYYLTGLFMLRREDVRRFFA